MKGRSVFLQPPRDVPPVVWFDTTDLPPLLVENFPFDKYELEPSPLTQFILQKRNPSVCWQVGLVVWCVYSRAFIGEETCVYLRC